MGAFGNKWDQSNLVEKAPGGEVKGLSRGPPRRTDYLISEVEITVLHVVDINGNTWKMLWWRINPKADERVFCSLEFKKDLFHLHGRVSLCHSV